MVCIFGPVARHFRPFVAEEVGIRAGFLSHITPLSVRVGAQYINEEVRWNRSLNRVGLSESSAGITAGQLKQANVITGVRVERWQLTVGAERHGKEEADAVLFAGLGQDHDPIEKSVGAFFGGHLADVGSNEPGAGGGGRWFSSLLPAPCSSHRDNGHQRSQGRTRQRPWEAGPPAGGSRAVDGGSTLVAKAGSGRELGAASVAGHRLGNVTRAGYRPPLAGKRGRR